MYIFSNKEKKFLDTKIKGSPQIIKYWGLCFMIFQKIASSFFWKNYFFLIFRLGGGTPPLFNFGVQKFLFVIVEYIPNFIFYLNVENSIKLKFPLKIYLLLQFSKFFSREFFSEHIFWSSKRKPAPFFPYIFPPILNCSFLGGEPPPPLF